jgi:hypothetical protein
MNNVVLQYKERLVAGFSLKTQKVYTTVDTKKAKQFTAVSANKFISLHFNNSDMVHITMHVRVRGKEFNPLGYTKQSIGHAEYCVSSKCRGNCEKYKETP